MSRPEIIVTEDGSNTLFSNESGENYHSIHGAVQESMHVFILAGFHRKASDSDNLRILEIGFGTGLNCLLTLAESVKINVKVEYNAIEPYPIDQPVYSNLNFCSLDGLKNFHGEFLSMHGKGNGIIDIEPCFRLLKFDTKLGETTLEAGYFDLVYFDAFSPESQPEMWQPEVFLKIRAGMSVGGVLVTYCAKGEVRRVLQKSGFSTERLPGPPGKREMLRATAI